MQHAFLYTSLWSLHDHDVKCPCATCYGRRRRRRERQKGNRFNKQNNIFARELTKILLFITQIRIENVIPSLASTITVTLSHQTVSIERTIIS